MWQGVTDNFSEVLRNYDAGKPLPPPASLGLLPVTAKE